MSSVGGLDVRDIVPAFVTFFIVCKKLTCSLFGVAPSIHSC